MRNITKAAIAVAVVLALAGCKELSIMTEKREPGPVSGPRGGAGYLGETVDVGEKTDRPSAIDAAMELFNKHREDLAKLEEVRKERDVLRKDNHTLLAQVAGLQTKLERAQKELGEANTMLVDLRKDLKIWKDNVLEYRGQIQEALRAQAEYLRRITLLLGGTLPDETPAKGPTTQPVAGRQEEKDSESSSKSNG